MRQYDGATTLDAQGKLVTPGLVDPHTHLIWAGDRADEFERRIAGATYQEIMAEGGGIVRTVEATRAADLATLVEQSKARLVTMLAHGTTTVEIKTGYGLTTESEIAMLNAAALLDSEHPVDVALTFLGAHAIPREYADNPDGYVDLVVDEMLPAVAEWRGEHWPGTLFCDVFCETGAFDLAQTRRILEAAREHGMALKVHVDEFESLGGARLAAELGAVSVDHIVATPDEDIEAVAASNTVMIARRQRRSAWAHFPNARRWLDAGAPPVPPAPAAWNEYATVMAWPRAICTVSGGSAAAATINAAFAIGRGNEVNSLSRQAGDSWCGCPEPPASGYRFGAESKWW